MPLQGKQPEGVYTGFTSINRSNCYRAIKFLLPVLEITLGRQLILPQRQIHSVEEFLLLFPEVKDVFLDGTDRRVQRPKNKKRQNKLYSGKRKATTRKNIVVSDEKRRILYLSPTKSGRRHDKRLGDKMGLGNLPSEISSWVDTGFQGLQKIHPNTQIPKKRSRDKPLSQQDKENILKKLRFVSVSILKKLTFFSINLSKMGITPNEYYQHLFKGDSKVALDFRM